MTLKPWSRKRKITVINIAVLLLIVVVTAWYVSNNWQQFAELSVVEPLWLLPAALAIIATIYTVGMLMEMAIEPHGVKLTKSELFGLSGLNRFGNYVSPGYLGAAIRATYLKTNYDISIARFSSSFIISNLMQFIMSGLVVISLAGIIFSANLGSGIAPLIALIVTVIVFLILLFMPLGWISNQLSKLYQKKQRKLYDRLLVLISGYIKVRSHPRLLPRMIVWALLTILASTVSVQSLYSAIGIDATFTESLFIASLSSWSILFSITPAGIGIREGLMSFAAKLVQVSVPATLIVAVMLRIITFVVASLMALIYAPKLLGKSIIDISSSFKNRDNN